MIDLGPQNIPKDFLKRGFYNVMEFIQAVDQEQYAYNFLHFFETSDFFTFSFQLEKQRKLVIVNKSSGNATVISRFIVLSHSNQEIQLDLSELNLIGSSDTHLIFAIQAPLYREKYQDDVQVSFSDNPIIYLAEL